MLVVITTISLCAHIYSIEYMSEDPHKIRFFSYLSLFTFFMILLVLSDNALQLFVGWEGVGICPYPLINFWFTRVQANKSSILAVITNKVGDIAMLLGCILLQIAYKSVDFSIIGASVECANLGFLSFEEQCLDQLFASLGTDFLYFVLGTDGAAGYIKLYAYYGAYSTLITDLQAYNTAVCLLLILASVGKSAQAGLHIWLPEAMEGPTPVSSLIHAATMVTAGIFLISRFSFLFDCVGNMFVLLILIGSVTAFRSSTIGLLQTDIKKVVAYSTCSQLGYMSVCRGFSAYNNSMYHLFNHAFFKALLFLTAGYVIHALSNEQDIRRMGSLPRLLPLSYMMMLVGSLSLIGFPFSSGFYSKDKIIELCFNNIHFFTDYINTYRYVVLAQILCLLAVIFTSVYSTRVLFYVYFNSFCGSKSYVSSIHYSYLFIQLPLMLLAVFSITSGYITSDMMTGLGTNFWIKCTRIDSASLDIDDRNVYKSYFPLHTEFTQYVRHITLVWTVYFVTSALVAITDFKYISYYLAIDSYFVPGLLFRSITRKYAFVNRLLIVPIVRSSFTFAYNVTYKMFDKGLAEVIGPFGIVSSLRNMLWLQNKAQSGFLYHHSGSILTVLIVLVHVFIDTLYH